MFTLRRLCLVRATQRCIDSDEIEAEARISDMTASANLSRLPYESKYAGLQEPAAISPSGPRLVLSILETVEMDPATVVEIEPAGMRSSVRFGSGCVIAGADEECDIKLPRRERGVGLRQFQIDYLQRKQCYAVKDLGDGTGTFIRLDVPFSIQRTAIISFGDSHMKVSVQDELQSPSVEVTFLEGAKKDESFTFTPEQSPVKIGRMAGATIHFDDESLSRCQCSVTYAAECGWSVSDGDGVKKSTNGTWLFAEEPCELRDGTVLKAGQTLFKASLELLEGQKDCD